MWKFDGVNWIWMAGSDLPYQGGIYGTKGIASPSNVPGARTESATWYVNDSFWLFGGDGHINDTLFGKILLLL